MARTKCKEGHTHTRALEFLERDLAGGLVLGAVEGLSDGDEVLHRLGHLEPLDVEVPRVREVVDRLPAIACEFERHVRAPRKRAQKKENNTKLTTPPPPPRLGQYFFFRVGIARDAGGACRRPRTARACPRRQERLFAFFTSTTTVRFQSDLDDAEFQRLEHVSCGVPEHSRSYTRTSYTQSTPTLTHQLQILNPVVPCAGARSLS